MSNFLQDFVTWMEAVPPLWAYGAILLIAYGENVVPPIPGDMVVVFGGYLAGIGELDFLVVVLLSTVGGALGFMTMFAIGYVIGDAVKNPDRFRWIPTKQIVKAESWLERWGYGLVAANRFLSGLRSVISLAVGITRLNPFYTALFATLGAVVWTALIAYAGYAVGDNWPTIGTYLRDYGRAVMALVLLALVVHFVRRYLKRSGSKPRRHDSGNFKKGGG